MSLEKTELMRVPPRSNEQPSETLTIRDKEIKEVNEFVYLGSTLGNQNADNYGAMTDTRRRISKAGAAFGHLRGVWKSNLRSTTKGRILSTCIGNTLLYGAEDETITRSQAELLRRFWYGCQKSIKNLTLHVKQNDLLEKFGVPDIRTTCKVRTAGLMGHIAIARIETERNPFPVYLRPSQTPARTEDKARHEENDHEPISRSCKSHAGYKR